MSVNEWQDPREETGKDIPENSESHGGHSFQPKEENISINSTPKSREQLNLPKEEEPVISERNESAKRLRVIADAEELDFEEFIPLANESIAKAGQLRNRIAAAKEMVLDVEDDFAIELEEPYKTQLKRLIGKDKVDKEAIQCLNKLAHYNRMNEAYDPGAGLGAAEAAVEEAFSEEAQQDAFPDFGFDLFVYIFYLVNKVLTEVILSKLCALTVKALKVLDVIPIPPKVGTALGNIFAKIYNGAGNATIDVIARISIALIDIPGIPKSIFREKIKGVGAAQRHQFYICGEPPVDISVELLSIFDAVFPGAANAETDPELAKSRCEDDDYVPTPTEQGLARKILEEAIREESGSQNSHLLTKEKIDNNKNKSQSNVAMSYSMLDKVDTDTANFEQRAQGIVNNMYSPDGHPITDKVDAAMLGFFATMNGTLQRVDTAVTNIIALEFMSPQIKKWVCCFVRFVYLMLPRITSSLGANSPTRIPGAADGALDLDNEAFIEDAKIWVQIIDSFLQIISGSVNINFDLSMLTNIGDIFINALKMALAEGASVLTTALYSKVKKEMFGALNNLKEFPDLAAAIEACPPFEWFIDIFECGIEGFFTKIHNLIAQLWAEGANAMEDIDINVAITAQNGTIGILSNLLKVLLEWDKALINFCSLKTLATEAEKEELIGRIEASIEGTYKTERSESFKNAFEQSNEVYDHTINLGPVAPDETDDIYGVNQHTAQANPLYKSAQAALQEVYSDGDGDNNIDFEELDQPLVELETQLEANILTSVPSNRTWSPVEVMKSCGDEINQILADRIRDIEEVHFAVAKGSLADPTNIVDPDALPPEDAAQAETDRIEDINQEVNNN